MRICLEENNDYILRFDQGDEVIRGLQRFCRRKNIRGGFFRAIGACSEVEIGMYDLNTKEYVGDVYEEPMEIASLTGNISEYDEEISIHAHGVFAGRDHKPVAGHVSKLIISVTCEVALRRLEGSMERHMNEDIGLPLICGNGSNEGI